MPPFTPRFHGPRLTATETLAGAESGLATPPSFTETAQFLPPRPLNESTVPFTLLHAISHLTTTTH